MVSMLELSTVDCWFEARSDQTEDCKIGICYLHAALSSKRKDWWDQNLDNVLEWSDMSTHRLVSVS
jgi:hypothetical protein